MDEQGFADIRELNFQLGAVGVVLKALVATHPAPAAFAAELLKIAAALQVAGAAQGAAMPPEMRAVLEPLLALADRAAASPKQG